MSGRVSTGIHGWMNDILHKSNMFKTRIERFPDLRIWPCEYFQNLTYLQFSKLSELMFFLLKSTESNTLEIGLGSPIKNENFDAMFKVKDIALSFKNFNH